MSAPTADSNRFPSQAKFILGNEAAERFSYYGMKGILALYITNVLLKDRDYSTNVIHIFGFVNYFMPLLGAWVSDRLWGRYRTILWISLSYCVGHGVLALSDAFHTSEAKVWCLFVGLGLIAFGSGGIKPCVSAFMGDQFKAEQRHLLPKAYAAFYWCINLGSTASFLIIPWIRKEYGYSWAFGVPGIAMALATFIFWLGTKKYLHVQPAGDDAWPTKLGGILATVAAIVGLVWLKLTGSAWFGWALWGVMAAAALVLIVASTLMIRRVRRSSSLVEAAPLAVWWYALIGRLLLTPGGLWDDAKRRFAPTSLDNGMCLGRILGIFALIPVFWALFDQTFSTWVLQGEQMRPCYVASASVGSRDIRNPDAIVTQLSTSTNAAAQFIWSRFADASRVQLTGPGAAPDSKSKVLALELNQLVGGAAFYDEKRFLEVKLGKETLNLLKASPAGREIARANRLLLEDVFPQALAKSYRIGPEEMLSANPILVMIFIPIMAGLVYPALGRWATPLRRMGAGMFLGAGSFVIVAWLQQRLDAGAQLSILWQIVPYLVLTLAEVLFSTTGLEFAFREAAPTMKSTIMGFWSLTVAIGNLLVSIITTFAGTVLGTKGGHDVSVSPKMFLFYAGLTFVVAILFAVICAFYRYRDTEAAQGR